MGPHTNGEKWDGAGLKNDHFKKHVIYLFSANTQKISFSKNAHDNRSNFEKKSYQTFIFMNGCGGEIVVCSFALYSSDPS